MTLAELRERATIPVAGFRTWPKPLGAMSITLEDGEFLYGLVRAAKPSLVVESGTGLGISAVFIATALADNGAGRLVSFESDHWIADEARKLTAGLPAEIRQGGSDESGLDADLAFVDSHAGRRQRDIAYWLGTRALVVVHDAMREYDEFELGTGVLIPGSDGLWIGRGK